MNIVGERGSRNDLQRAGDDVAETVAASAYDEWYYLTRARGRNYRVIVRAVDEDEDKDKAAAVAAAAARKGAPSK